MTETLSLWLPEFQTFRGLAILEIVIRHVTYFGSLGVVGLLLIPSPTRELLVLITASVYLAIPQFVFISGVVLYNKYKRDFALAEFYKKRVNSVLWPYLIFSAFYFVFPYVVSVLVPHFFDHSVYAPLWTYYQGYWARWSGTKLLVVPLELIAEGNIAHLWFILLILQLYALYPFIVKGYNRIARHRGITVFALLALLGVQIVYTALFVVVPPYALGLSRFRVLFVSAIFYFALGIVVCDHYDVIKRWVEKARLLPLFIVTTFSTVGYGVAFYHTFLTSGSPVVYRWLYLAAGPVYSMLLIVFYLKISLLWSKPRNPVTRLVAKIGADSFGIYLVHFFYVLVFGTMLIRLGLPVTDLLFYPILVVAVLAASYATVHVIYRLPYSRIIIGRSRERKSTQIAKQKPHSPYYLESETGGKGRS
ncbi:MAG: acyltransferase [Halobacteriota archaeon]